MLGKEYLIEYVQHKIIQDITSILHDYITNPDDVSLATIKISEAIQLELARFGLTLAKV